MAWYPAQRVPVISVIEALALKSSNSVTLR